MIRTFVLSGAASALSMALYAVFVVSVGPGTGSDAFFAALVVAQTMGGLLFAPYETFAQRFALDRMRAGTPAVAPLVASYLGLSGIVLVPYYLWGEALFAPLFASISAADPALWRHHFRVLGALVPLSGVVAMIQICSQARGRLRRPKAAAVVARLVAIGLLLAAATPLYTISVVVVAGQLVAVAVSAPGAGRWIAAPGPLLRDAGLALREWFSVNRWTMVLKTDQLLERVLAARVTPGFLSLFNIGWSGVTSVVEAFHSAFVVADSNRYHAAVPARPAGGLRALLAGPYRMSGVVGARLMGAAAALGGAAAAAALVSGWSPGGVRGPQIALLLATLAAALAPALLSKQVAGAYAIQRRAVELARGLALVYVSFAIPRVALTWQLGAVGFCVGLAAYYGMQAWWMGRRV